MITDDLVTYLQLHPGLPVMVATFDAVEYVVNVEIDCFDVNEGRVVVLLAKGAV